MTATVLVVDDNEKNAKLLEEKLASEYYVVLKAYSGIEALDIMAKHKVDIVLLDVMMPGLDGFDTCRRIKSNPATTHIPVVMVTALSEMEDRVNGLEVGADEFLSKPVRDIELFARVRSLTRMKLVVDEIQLRNKTNIALGLDSKVVEFRDEFGDSKILLIDDDKIQAKNIKNNLADLTSNFKIIAKSDELKDLGAFLPDLIIISCQVGHEDPLRIITNIRAKPELKNTFILMLAEEENQAIVIRALELGIHDYCIYQVDKSEIIARVKTLLRRKTHHDNLRNELEETVHLGTKDSLTSVYNRRYFDTHVGQIASRNKANGKPFCLMMIDMDHFKQVNDQYGHISGDEVLKTLTKKLKQSFRVTDLIARYGGEEFSVVLNNVDLEGAKEIGERIRKMIEETDFQIPVQDEPIKCTTSIGIAQFEDHEKVPDFIHRADQALYKAKAAGRNVVICQ